MEIEVVLTSNLKKLGIRVLKLKRKKGDFRGKRGNLMRLVGIRKAWSFGY